MRTPTRSWWIGRSKRDRTAWCPSARPARARRLSHDEHKRVIELCIEVAAKRVPVIAGAGSNSTSEAIDFTKHAKKAGATAVLHSTGYYNKPTQEGLFQHFKAINDAVDLPIIVYNVPVRTIVDIQAATFARIAELKNVVGIKDATANVARMSAHRQLIKKPISYLSGEDGTALGFNAQGGQGCISVTANVAPRLCAEFQNACLAGDYKKALALHDRLMPLHDTLFIETNPAPVKYALWRIGVINSAGLPFAAGAAERGLEEGRRRRADGGGHLECRHRENAGGGVSVRKRLGIARRLDPTFADCESDDRKSHEHIDTNATANHRALADDSALKTSTRLVDVAERMAKPDSDAAIVAA